MSLELLAVGAIGASILVYLLSGGADYGGGVWDLLASGPRKEQHRAVIDRALAPIWEANHVWLILVVVLLFVGFPRAFATITTALHIPLTVLLLGIVLRGSAFVFRHYGRGSAWERQAWGAMLGGASIITPVMLGVCVGALGSGQIRVDDGRIVSPLDAGWTEPFAWAVGLLTLALCAQLAATYLCVRLNDPRLRDDFRLRALGAAVASGIFAAGALGLAGTGAPVLRAELTGSAWAWPLHLVTGACAIGSIAMLWTRRFELARAFAIGQCAGIVVGWGLAQGPYLIVPDLTYMDAATHPAVLEVMLGILAVGTVLLVPSFLWLYSLFAEEQR